MVMKVSAKEQYENKKSRLIQELKSISLASNSQLTLKKNTSNLFRARSHAGAKIDVRAFNRVINVDAENLIAEVEGMTTYESLVNECLKYDCLPAVVPELKSITVGGALSGCAIESSSFRYGLVHETFLEFEVLLSDGRIITCTPTNEHKDLFFAFPNSYGTFGYALKIKLKLIPAKKYLKLSHHRFSDSVAYFEQLNQWCLANKHSGSVAYIDGVVFDKNEMYITTAEFVDEVPYVSNYQYMKVYYKSIQKNKIDYLTAHDYIWRWDTDWFWCSKFFFMQNFLLRLIFGKFILKSTSFWKIRNFMNRNFAGKIMVDLMLKNTEAVIQDVQIPVQNAAKFLEFFQDKIKITPVWICPTMPYSHDKKFTLYTMDPDTLFINFGFWDVVPAQQQEGYANILVEKKVTELAGHKGLYSNIYYNEDEFWNIYDKVSYLSLKNQYDPDSRLKNLYQKCSEK